MDSVCYCFLDNLSLCVQQGPWPVVDFPCSQLTWCWSQAVSPVLFNVALEGPATANRQEEEIESHCQQTTGFLRQRSLVSPPKQPLKLQNELGRIAGFEVIIQKSAKLCDSNSQHVEIEREEGVPFSISNNNGNSSRIKYLGGNRTKEVKQVRVHSGSRETLRKGFERVTNKWKHTKCSGRQRINIVPTKSNLCN